MEPRKLTSADIDKVRHIEGFPIATDDAIIELSDAPYYTACPNPFIEDFIAEYGTPYDEATDDYHREPFTSDVSEGKNDPIYMAHSYHTKVPYKAIMRYIQHYTKPGDIVFDGFAGTGMTGVASKMCGRQYLEQLELGLSKDEIESGERAAILCDLSPAATFIAHHYNHEMDAAAFRDEAERILAECEQECGWMFETKHSGNGDRSEIGRINYTVWSEVFICPSCSEEFVFWDAAVDNAAGKVMKEFSCPHCGAKLTKRDCSKAQRTYYEAQTGEAKTVSKLAPVLINYTYGRSRFEKKPDSDDLRLLERIESASSKYWYPTDRMPEGKESRRNDVSGIEYVNQFYFRRNLMVLAAFVAKARKTNSLILMQAVAMVNTKLYRYRWAGGFAGAGGGPLAGTLYIPSLIKDINLLKSLHEYINKTAKAKALLQQQSHRTIITTQSATSLSQIPDCTCDYIFTDPPFGDNLNYSELSFLWEAWLRVKTNSQPEAIINPVQNKQLLEYQDLMAQSFSEFYRILKPGRWMTVEFHNSKNAVWNAIQEALQRAGFVIADVRTLDKKQGSFKQVNSSSSVKQDLIISTYKPKRSFISEFSMSSGSPETCWAFVQQHLENLPAAVVTNGRIEVIAERQGYLLFDRMVAYHVTRGIPVPVDASDFYRGLDERYIKRDEMFFLPEQVAEYDSARIKMDIERVDFALFVTNEKTAIGWLHQLLLETPMTYQQIQPKFMQEVKTVDRYEEIPELSILLEENFLQDEQNRWYVPDVTKEGDIAKLREKSLLREFDGYLKSKGKLKLFRSEAIRVGFSHLWKDKNYQAIVDLANRLPAATIQEDPNLLMYYDISLSRVG